MSKSAARWQAGLYCLLILFLYGLSFFLPVYSGGTQSKGYHVFFFGILGMFILPFLAFPWLANLFLWVAWGSLLAGNFRGARKMGTLATALAASYVPVCLVWWWLDDFRYSLPSFGFGYLFWFLSMASVAGAGYALEIITSKNYHYDRNPTPFPPAASIHETSPAALRRLVPR